MTKRTTHPDYFADADGRRLVRIAVHGSESPAITEAVLFDNAQRRHGLTGNLYMTGGRRRYVHAWLGDRSAHTTTARLLIDCPKGYRVHYRDGNPLNLLPENLRLVAPWADDQTAMQALALLLDAARGDDTTAEVQA